MSRWRKIANPVREQLGYYRRLASDPRTPDISKWLIGAAIAYLLSPIDLIPDFIPVIGHLDDLVIVPLLLYLAAAMIPEAVRMEARQCHLND